MKPVIYKQKSLAIVYDASTMKSPSADYFSVEFWKSRQAVTGEAVGRGSAWFINAPFGEVVLRHYLRGGWIAKLSQNRYFFTVVPRSRPFREYHLLVSLYALGLPVPRPVAALCEYHGISATGAILTACIPSARTLADLLSEPAGGFWRDVGNCIRRFHDAGVWHADLNARNILLNAERQVFLIDFDRARYTPGKAVNGEGNLKRLKRSLIKVWPAGKLPAMQLAWDEIKAGYRG